ncbi:hypothetical protein Lepto7376_4318 [[Leptolyngbya] sp. PCC 7376]|nr:hypothetical protein Lepto7376_4318 [[Leptolyngbya] sp. PCC 7376]
MFFNQRSFLQNTTVLTMAIAAGLNISQPASSQTTVSLPGFDPSDDGFQFSNQTMANSLESSADLKSSIIRNYATGYADTLKFLFGEKAVCQGYDENGECYTSFQARQWMSDQALLAANYGVCDGMAVASQLLWLIENQDENPFSDRSQNLSNLLGGQTDIAANSLSPSNSRLQELILEAYASQTADEIYESITASRQKLPSELLENIADSIGDYAEDPSKWQGLLTIGINRIAPDGRLIDGHTLVPFAAEIIDAEKLLARVHVYDVNHPNTTQYLEIDAAAETWRYQPEGDTAYEGNAETKSLGVVSLAERAIPYIDEPFASCPFCATGNSELEVSFVGVGELFIVPFGFDGESETEGIGFDPDKKEYVDTLPGASMIATQGGLGQSVARNYTVPGDLEGYSVSYIGLPESGLDGYISLTKPGITAQLNKSKVVPFLASLDYAHRRQLIYNPNPKVLKFKNLNYEDVSFTVDDETNQVSYQVTFVGENIDWSNEESKKKSSNQYFRVDKGTMRVDFGGQNEYEDEADVFFNIEITRINSDGTKTQLAVENLQRKVTEFSSFSLVNQPWDKLAQDVTAHDINIDVVDLLKYFPENKYDPNMNALNYVRLSDYWRTELEKDIEPNYEQRPHRGTRKKGR